MKKKTSINVCWMHCRSCELLLEKSISWIDSNICKVDANENKGLVEITYDWERPDLKEIELVIKECWYSIWKKQILTWLNTDPKVYIDLSLSFFSIFALYLILSNLWFDISNYLTISKPSFSVAFLVWITAWFSSCMALIWWLVLWVSAKWNEDHLNLSKTKRFVPNIYFNLWRIIWFALFWGILWVFGSFFSISPMLISILTLVVSFIMFYLWLNLSDISPKISSFNLSLPKSISKFTWGWKWKQRHFFALSSWAMTFFLPCWFTLAMQAYAISTQSFFAWAMTMAVFALWTSFWLLSVWWLSVFFGKSSSKLFFRFIWVLMIFLSLANMVNWSNILSESKTQNISKNTTMVEPTAVQEIEMTQSSSWYSPEVIKIKPNTKIKWHIKGTNPYSCSVQLLVPSLDINKTLDNGDNLIEFISPKEWEIPFSCWMWMYNWKLVVEEG